VLKFSVFTFLMTSQSILSVASQPLPAGVIH